MATSLPARAFARAPGTARRKAPLWALLATSACCGLAASPAAAQTWTVQPGHRAVDGNGVDLVNGGFYLDFKEGSIGSGKAELALVRRNANVSQWDNIFLERTQSGSAATVTVTVGRETETFTGTISSLTSTAADGGSLAVGGGGYLYTTHDGTVIEFTDPTNHGWNGATNLCYYDTAQTASCRLMPDQITAPDGKSLYLAWDIADHCSTTFNSDNSLDCQYFWRLSQIDNDFGYALRFAYASDIGGGTYGSLPPSAWTQRTQVDFFNSIVSTTSAQGSVTYAYPSSMATDVTDMAGRTWRFTALSGSGAPSGIRRPGASTDEVSVSYGTGTVAVTKNGVTTSYSRSVSGTTATTTVTDPLSHTTTVVADITKGRVTSITDALSHQTSYTYDSYGRLTRVTHPEGDYVNYTYDGRGNVTQTDFVPKSGSGLSTLTRTATFATSCSDPQTCNQSTAVTDARGNTTNYSYDADGNVTSVLAPAATGGATRPETRYSYTGGVLTGVSTCRTGSAPSCVGTSDEVKATIAYDTNGNVTSKSTGAGDASLTATSAMTYDAMGNLLTVDGPLSGSADTSRYRYNGARELVGVTSPDPDGSGAMKMRASRTTYDSHDLVTKVEQGTVNSQSDSDWASFSSLQEVDTGYDTNFRPVRQSLVSGGTTYALKQTSYGAAGRVQCTAQRMNPTYFGSLPSDACTLGTTSTIYGADRITKTGYDWDGRPNLVQTGYAVTGTQADEVATDYTNNGKVASVTDAEGNKTSYVYDGFDRLYQTQFPSTTKGAGSSNSSDYEQLGYDANGNVTSLRNRANETASFTFDALNRMTYKDLPGTEPDVTYAYDLLGRMTSAATSSQTLSFTYDALGRNLTQVGPQGTLTSTWDIAGRRTRIAHPDGFYVDQD